MASLLKRTQEAALPASQVDPAVPRQLSGIVAKCLERDVTKRYQTIDDLLKRPEGFLMAAVWFCRPHPEFHKKYLGSGRLCARRTHHDSRNCEMVIESHPRKLDDGRPSNSEGIVGRFPEQHFRCGF